MTTIRKLLIATAFSAGVAGALSGAAASGETQEINTAKGCAAAEWPMIPPQCLEGAPARDVRYVTANLNHNLQARFAAAFQ